MNRMSWFAGLVLLLLVACGSKPVGEPLDTLSPCWRSEFPWWVASQPLRWIQSQDPAERADARRWCAAVGPPLILEAAGADTIPQLDSLLIVSWNTHSGNGDLDLLLEDLRSGALTGGKKIRHFVLLLQEVRRAGPPVPRTFPLWAQTTSRILTAPSGECLQLEDVAHKYGFDIFYVPAMRNCCREEPGAPEDRGNSILSTLSLRELTAVELPVERQRRVTIGASVDGITRSGESWTLSIWNVHLENRSKWYRFTGSFQEGRLRQIRFLLDAIPMAEPSVLAGDFNTWFGGSEESAVDLVHRRFPQPDTIPTQRTQRRSLGIYRSQVDYVFFRLPEGWHGRYQRIDNTYGSDHYPLLAWVRCGRSDPCVGVGE